MVQFQIDYNNVQSFDDIKDKIRPFDILGFRGSDTVSDMVVKLQEEMTGGNIFSHVGMVITAELLPTCVYNDVTFHLQKGKIYVFESTISYNLPGPSDGTPDVITGDAKLGVQLRDMDEIIHRYLKSDKAKIAWCKLINNPFDKYELETDTEFRLRRVAIREQFKSTFDNYHWRIYEMDLVSLVGALFPSTRFVRDIRDKLITTFYLGLQNLGLAKVEDGPAGWQFCCSLIANIYREYGIIDKSINPKDVLPVDFFGYDVDGLPVLTESPVFIKP